MPQLIEHDGSVARETPHGTGKITGIIANRVRILYVSPMSSIDDFRKELTAHCPRLHVDARRTIIDSVEEYLHLDEDADHTGLAMHLGDVAERAFQEAGKRAALEEKLRQVDRAVHDTIMDILNSSEL